MTSSTNKSNRPVPQTGNPPYPYRTVWALVLLVGNFIVAAIYFHILSP